MKSAPRPPVRLPARPLARISVCFPILSLPVFFLSSTVRSRLLKQQEKRYFFKDKMTPLFAAPKFPDPDPI